MLLQDALQGGNGGGGGSTTANGCCQDDVQRLAIFIVPVIRAEQPQGFFLVGVQAGQAPICRSGNHMVDDGLNQAVSIGRLFIHQRCGLSITQFADFFIGNPHFGGHHGRGIRQGRGKLASNLPVVPGCIPQAGDQVSGDQFPAVRRFRLFFTGLCGWMCLFGADGWFAKGVDSPKTEQPDGKHPPPPSTEMSLVHQDQVHQVQQNHRVQEERHPPLPFAADKLMDAMQQAVCRAFIPPFRVIGKADFPADEHQREQQKSQNIKDAKEQ